LPKEWWGKRRADACIQKAAIFASHLVRKLIESQLQKRGAGVHGDDADEHSDCALKAK
jgi:hypothetical protein